MSAVAISLVHAEFFRNQRLKLIDRQISESSEVLLSSPLFIRSVESLDEVDETISKTLKGARIGKVFIVRDSNAGILFQSFNVGLLNTDIPIQPEWVTVETDSEYARVRNLKIPGKMDYVLQIGLVLDRNFLNWKIIDRRLVNYVVGIVLALFLAAVVLTLILLSPLRSLITYLSDSTSNLSNLRDVSLRRLRRRR